MTPLPHVGRVSGYEDLGGMGEKQNLDNELADIKDAIAARAAFKAANTPEELREAERVALDAERDSVLRRM